MQEKILEYRDKGLYQLHRYVIMPDHIHALLTPGEATSLERAMQHIKGGSSRGIAKRFGSHFPVWQPGFAEHRIRDGADFAKHAVYIDLNPVKSGLAVQPAEYPFGSAGRQHRLDAWPLASGAEAPS